MQMQTSTNQNIDIHKFFLVIPNLDVIAKILQTKFVHYIDYFSCILEKINATSVSIYF